MFNKIAILLAVTLLGLFFLAFGVAGVAMEYKTPPLHTTHLFIFCGMILLGALLLPGVGTIVLAKMKGGLDLARENGLTFGRRASQGEVSIIPPADTPKDKGQ